MSASPITAADFPSFNPAADLCTKMDQLFSVTEKLQELLDFLFDDAGNWTDGAKEQLVEAAMPIGSVIMFAGSSVPSDKWLICNGNEVSRSTYSDLFLRIGTIHGSGNGSTTFNLPNLSSRIPIGVGTEALAGTAGARTVVLTAANIPEHTHAIAAERWPQMNRFGSSANEITLHTLDVGDAIPGGSAGSGVTKTDTDTGVNTTTAEAHSNLPPVVGIYFLIKAKA